jgi:hypothetical protein
MLAGIVDLSIDRGRKVATMLNDPIVGRLFADHAQFHDAMHRLRRIAVGEDRGSEAHVRLAMLVAAISGAVMHPFTADLDDDVLRAELLRLARRFLGLPG